MDSDRGAVDPLILTADDPDYLWRAVDVRDRADPLGLCALLRLGLGSTLGISVDRFLPESMGLMKTQDDRDDERNDRAQGTNDADDEVGNLNR